MKTVAAASETEVSCLRFTEGFDPKKRYKTEVRQAIIARKRPAKRVLESCIQVAQKIPGAKLRFTKNDNPYFIITLAQADGTAVDASIMPFLKPVEGKNGKPKRKRDRIVQHLQVCLRWPFGDTNTAQQTLYFDNVNQCINYLSQ